MAQRIVGLCGRGKGPRIFVGHEATVLHAEVRGLPPEASVTVLVWNEHDEYTVHHVRESGEQELPLGHSVEFMYEGTGLPICAVKVA